MHEPWAQVFIPENQNTEQAQGPANHAKQATSVDFNPRLWMQKCFKNNNFK